ncbi:MAG: TetR/AcrR family transcriptional regulator [Rhizobiaceae bacterium]|nr:TetR/AcrR family transcriptional regulator [Rhizobiaceae bacterium]
MPRTKTLPDDKVLELALAIIHERGPEALTFDSLSRACGLSGATLVQRFGNKADLKQAALLRAWDGLDARTTELDATMPATPAGAIELLVALSGSYGGIESYAEGLLVLREDLRDPALRARGAAWKATLSQALSRRLASLPGAPEGAGLMMATQWQGALLWWGFDPAGKVEDHVCTTLTGFLAALVPDPG